MEPLQSRPALLPVSLVGDQFRKRHVDQMHQTQNTIQVEEQM